MTRGRNAKEEAAMQAKLVALDNARDAGRLYFKSAPNLMLVEVSQRGSALYDNNNHMIAFLQGYIEARSNHDAFRRGE